MATANSAPLMAIAKRPAPLPQRQRSARPARILAWLLVGATWAAVGCASPGRRSFMSSCGVSSECQSDLCWQGFCSSACTSSEQCGSAGVCTAAHCSPRPSSDTQSAADGTAQDTTDASAAGSKLVFVTSLQYTAGLGGLAGADAKCQSLATAAQRQGTFKAWLSDSKSSPASRFSEACKGGGPFVLADGTLVAADWGQLTSGKLLHAISLTEKGTAPPTGKACGDGKGTGIWTGTLNNGAIDTTHIAGECADWTTSAMTYSGQMVWGNPASTQSWSSDSNCSLFGATICSRSASLFCFEQ